MPTNVDTAAFAAAEDWARAVRDRCGERHVSGPTFDIQNYGSMAALVKAGTDAAILHATLRSLPITADQPGSLSDGLITVFHQSPKLEAMALNLPLASSEAMLAALDELDRPNPGPRKVCRLREVNGELVVARKAQGAAGYGQLPYNVAPITAPHWEDEAPVRTLHTQELLVWAQEIQGMTSPERYTSIAGDVPLVFPAAAEPVIGTDDGRVVVPLFRGVNEDLSALKDEQHCRMADILSADEVDTLATLANSRGHAAKYAPIFQHSPWERRVADSRERTVWYPSNKDGAAALDAVHRITAQVEAAAGTKLVHRKWGFVRVTKHTAAGTLTPRQAWHRDIDRSLYPDDAAAYSCLIPVTHDIVTDGMEGQFVAASVGGYPDPWQVEGMTATLGSGWIFDSRTIHRGGSVPRAARDDRLMLFLAMTELPYDYNVSCPVTPPFWAPSDDVPLPLGPPDDEGNQSPTGLDPLNCRHAIRFDGPDSASSSSSSSSSSSVAAATALACGRCTEVLAGGGIRCMSQSCRRSLCARCRTSEEFCARCEHMTSIAAPTLETAEEDPASDTTKRGTELRHALNTFATAANTHLALWVTSTTSPSDTRDPADPAPTFADCPMQPYHWQAFPSTATVRADASISLLYIRPSSVAVARNCVGGVAWTEGPAESRGSPQVWRWLMMPRGLRATDPSIVVQAGWAAWWNGTERVVSGAVSDGKLWCACEQVLPLSSLPSLPRLPWPSVAPVVPP
jgi:hypothetical protein